MMMFLRELESKLKHVVTVSFSCGYKTATAAAAASRTTEEVVSKTCH